MHAAIILFPSRTPASRNGIMDLTVIFIFRYPLPLGTLFTLTCFPAL